MRFHVLFLCAALTLIETAGAQITNVSVRSVSKSIVTVQWKTDVPATTEIRYGTTTAYGKEVVNSTLITNHTWFVSGLAPDTLYHFCPYSKNAAGAALGSCDGSFDFMFRTLPATAVPELPEPPRARVDTSMPVQNGRTLLVDGTDCNHPALGLQARLEEARGGDTVVIPAATECRGMYELPARVSGDEGWIVVRTSTPDSQLPQGRISASDQPFLARLIGNALNYHATLTISCSGGSGALWYNQYSRPAGKLGLYRCNADGTTGAEVPFTTGPSLPKTCVPDQWFLLQGAPAHQDVYRCIRPNEYVNIVPGSNIGSPQNCPLYSASKDAHHYRIIGLELTHVPHPASDPHPLLRDAGSGREAGALQWSLATFNGHHIVLDRSYLHGHDYPSRTFFGVVSNAPHFALINSVVDKIALWTDQDGGNTEASAVYLNDAGPMKIENNRIEAAGITVFAPGEGASNTNDVEFLRNYVFKPTRYLGGSADSDGLHYNIRHHLELKAGRRWQIEGNVFQHNWSFKNQGAMITLSSRPTMAPDTGISDIVFRNNIIRSSPHVFAFLATNDNVVPEGSAAILPENMKRVLIENNLAYDINGFQWTDKDSYMGGTGSSGIFLDVTQGMEDLTVVHNTLFDNKGAWPAFVAHAGGPAHSGLLYRDNIVLFPQNTATGGANKGGIWANFESVQYDGKAALDHVWVAGAAPGWTMINNVIMLEGDRKWQANYPAGNRWPLSRAEIGFRDEGSRIYELLSQSPYKKAATDGTDIGVDWSLLTSATATTLTGRASGVPPSPPTGFRYTR